MEEGDWEEDDWDDEDEDVDFLSFPFQEDEEEETQNDEDGFLSVPDFTNLSSAIQRIGSSSLCNVQCDDDDVLLRRDLKERTMVVETYMGNMTLCRGAKGTLLYEAGAVEALLSTVDEIMPYLQSASSKEPPNAADYLAIACLGALRDLACGHADIRDAVREFRTTSVPDTSGLEILTRYLRRYHDILWQDLGPTQLRLLTNIIGVLRNVTHSTDENCIELHGHGVSELLTWRLLHGEGPANKEGVNLGLPHYTLGYREACFRAAATLINMAERINHCAVVYARNVPLIHQLVEVSGGHVKKTDLFHVGLIEILVCAKNELPSEEYSSTWDDLLEREELRRQRAQRREEERRLAFEKENKLETSNSNST